MWNIAKKMINFLNVGKKHNKTPKFQLLNMEDRYINNALNVKNTFLLRGNILARMKRVCMVCIHIAKNAEIYSSCQKNTRKTVCAHAFITIWGVWKCKEYLSATGEYFGYHPNTSDNLQSICKKCDNLRKKIILRKNHPKNTTISTINIERI